MVEPKLGDTVSVMFDGRIIATALDHLGKTVYHIHTPTGFVAAVYLEQIMFKQKEVGSEGTNSQSG